MNEILWQIAELALRVLVMHGMLAMNGVMVDGVRQPADLGRDLPGAVDPRYQPKLVTKVLDRNGELLASLHDDEFRERLVPIEEVPEFALAAFIAVEDRRFLSHDGVDPRAVARAVYRNLKAGRVVEGASTITQQLVKNRFLDSERSFRRKLEEMILAARLERLYSKRKILEQYLNEIFFGDGMYGISSAAAHYFGKPVSELTLGEAAMLAGMVRAPNRYSPFRNLEGAIERQRLVLEQMVELGIIDRKKADAVAEEPIQLTSPDEVRRHVDRAPYFTSEVKKWLVQTFGVEKAFGGGLEVRTTLDLRTQEMAERAFAGGPLFKGLGPDRRPELQGSFVAMDPTTGDVLAMIGGRSFEKTQFNRAVQAQRQPGSSFKPFIYTTALLKELAPNTVVIDEPISYFFPDRGAYWRPGNFGHKYAGATVLAKALAKSFNTVSVQLLDFAGVPEAIEVARRCGIRSPLHKGLSIALGSSGVNLLELAGAYTTFARMGKRAIPRMVLEVLDREGNRVYESKPDVEQAVDETTASLMTQMLRGVVERGTATRAQVEGHEIAGKTGTSNRFIDAWFIGFTPRILAGCFVGRDDNRSLGGWTGGKAAAPIVGQFLKEYLAGSTPEPFPIAPGVEHLEVCADSGGLATPGCDDVWNVAFDEWRAPAATCELHDTSSRDGYYATLWMSPLDKRSRRDEAADEEAPAIEYLPADGEVESWYSAVPEGYVEAPRFEVPSQPEPRVQEPFWARRDAGSGAAENGAYRVWGYGAEEEGPGESEELYVRETEAPLEPMPWSYYRGEGRYDEVPEYFTH